MHEDVLVLFRLEERDGVDFELTKRAAVEGVEQAVQVSSAQKGRDTKENILRNFGAAHPEGYRKALRLMRLAEKFHLPILTLIDTAGAYPGTGAEERHIAEAIAVNLREMMLLEVPIVAAVMGEPLPPVKVGAEDSRSFLPVILGDPSAQGREDMIVHGADGTFALRKGPWKWIEGVPVDQISAGARKSRQDQHRPQLYNLELDPAETKNVRRALLEQLAARELFQSENAPARIVGTTNEVAMLYARLGDHETAEVLDGRGFAAPLRGEKGQPRDWIFIQLARMWYVREAAWKLNQAGELSDMANAPFEEKLVAADTQDPAAIAARQRLQAVLDQLNPAGGILDDGDGTGRHANKTKKRPRT